MVPHLLMRRYFKLKMERPKQFRGRFIHYSFRKPCFLDHDLWHNRAWEVTSADGAYPSHLPLSGKEKLVLSCILVEKKKTVLSTACAQQMQKNVGKRKKKLGFRWDFYEGRKMMGGEL